MREVEDTLTDLQGRIPGLEKAKARLTAENSELTDELERVGESICCLLLLNPENMVF